MDIQTENTPIDALIVEGGGMRGTFPAGVLDAFMKEGFNPFTLCVGVSSGSTNTASFLSGQQGRSLQTYIDHSLRKPFLSYPRFFRGGDLMDLSWLWNTVEQEYPIDQQALFSNSPEFYMVLTHAINGEALYLKAAPDNLITGLMASSSIPVISRKPVWLYDEPYFDGGISDALPIKWVASHPRVRRIMVIRTRAFDYRKASSRFDAFAVRHYRRRAPLFSKKLADRVARYNQAVEFLRSSHHGLEIIEINPPASKKLAHVVTMNKKTLLYTYRKGVEAGYKAMEQWRRGE